MEQRRGSGPLAPGPVSSHPRALPPPLQYRSPASSRRLWRARWRRVTPDCAHHNFSHHTVCLRGSSSTRACVLGLVGFSPEDPQAVAPLCCRGSLWIKCTFVGCVSEAVCCFYKGRKKSGDRDPGEVNSLNITAQILASMPRFLINVILIGFRSLEMTK